MDVRTAFMDPEMGYTNFTVSRITYTRTASSPSSSTQTIAATGSIHPGTPEMIQLLPEEDRNEEFISIHTDFVLSLGKDNGSTYTAPDRITWDSRTWRVVRVRNWSMFGFVKALAVLLQEGGS